MEIPSPNSTEDVSDWVELYISYKNTRLSKSQLSSHIEGARGEEPDEGFINGVWIELQSREGQYCTPPFKVEANIVYPQINWKKIPSYLACLMFSVYGGTHDLFKSAKIFERITSKALQQHCGFQTKIFGWPVEGDDPKDIGTRAKMLAEEMNERFIEPPDYTKKDDTLDVVAWLPFYDKKSSQIVLLMQCATGGNWEGKVNELRLEAWKEYIHWGCRPVPGFAIPNIIGRNKWIDLARNHSLIFDRLRICNILLQSGEGAPLKRELIRWCSEKITSLDC